MFRILKIGAQLIRIWCAAVFDQPQIDIFSLLFFGLLTFLCNSVRKVSCLGSVGRCDLQAEKEKGCVVFGVRLVFTSRLVLQHAGSGPYNRESTAGLQAGVATACIPKVSGSKLDWLFHEFLQYYQANATRIRWKMPQSPSKYWSTRHTRSSFHGVWRNVVAERLVQFSA